MIEPIIMCITPINPLVVVVTKALGMLMYTGAPILVPGSVLGTGYEKGWEEGRPHS